MANVGGKGLLDHFLLFCSDKLWWNFLSSSFPLAFPVSSGVADITDNLSHRRIIADPLRHTTNTIATTMAKNNLFCKTLASYQHRINHAVTSELQNGLGSHKIKIYVFARFKYNFVTVYANDILLRKHAKNTGNFHDCTVLKLKKITFQNIIFAYVFSKTYK